MPDVRAQTWERMSAEKRLSDLFHALYDPMTTETLEAQESDLGRDSRDGRGRWAVDDIERGTHVRWSRSAAAVGGDRINSRGPREKALAEER